MTAVNPSVEGGLEPLGSCTAWGGIECPRTAAKKTQHMWKFCSSATQVHIIARDINLSPYLNMKKGVCVGRNICISRIYYPPSLCIGHGNRPLHTGR